MCCHATLRIIFVLYASTSRQFAGCRFGVRETFDDKRKENMSNIVISHKLCMQPLTVTVKSLPQSLPPQLLTLMIEKILSGASYKILS